MRFAVVLRAINVGRHNRVRMDVLRGALGDTGFIDVRSYLQTGNLTLDTDEPDPLVAAARVEAVLADIGLRAPRAIIRPWAEIVELAAVSPFTGYAVEEHLLSVSFCREAIPDPPTGPWTERGLTFLGGTPWALFAVQPRDLVRAPNANAIIERRWGIPASTRFWNVLTGWVEREAAESPPG